jgi:hypothetical protein
MTFSRLWLLWLLSSVMWRRVAVDKFSSVKTEAVRSSEKKKFQAESDLPRDSCCVLVWLIFWSWRWGQYIPPKNWWTTRMHGLTSQMLRFLATPGRSSNPSEYMSHMIRNSWSLILAAMTTDFSQRPRSWRTQRLMRWRTSETRESCGILLQGFVYETFYMNCEFVCLFEYCTTPYHKLLLRIVKLIYWWIGKDQGNGLLNIHR